MYYKITNSMLHSTILSLRLSKFQQTKNAARETQQRFLYVHTFITYARILRARTTMVLQYEHSKLHDRPYLVADYRECKRLQKVQEFLHDENAFLHADCWLIEPLSLVLSCLFLYFPAKFLRVH